MRILRILITISALLIFSFSTQAQSQKVTIQESSEFKSLLSEKRKINHAITTNDKYKIQVFYGSNAEASRKLSDFKRQFPHLDGTIIYTNPSYKVWVGNFKTRIEAERNLKAIQMRFENALIIKPNK